MQTAPELQILILNAVILGVAYLGIYPTLREKTLNKIMVIDLVLTGLALLVAGGWFMGGGVAFSLVLFEANWVIFTLVTLFVMEVPVFLWFAKRHGISLHFDNDQDD